MTQLLHILRQDPQDGLRQALCAAIASERPDCDVLEAAGIPRYHARAILQRLQHLEELRDGCWDATIRQAYLQALDSPDQRDHQCQRSEAQLQPREKARHHGIRALADAELMALLLRTGNQREGVLELAQRLVYEHEGLIGLADLDVEELMQAEGLGPAKATEIAAAFELGRRLARSRRAERVILRQPEDVAALLAHDMAPLRHEELWCLPLDTQSRLIGDVRMISRGDIDGTEAGPRAFFRKALQVGAASAIAVHNHPSGDPQASAADLAVTRRLRDAGRLLDVPLQDHLIIGDGGTYCSIRRLHPDLFQS